LLSQFPTERSVKIKEEKDCALLFRTWFLEMILGMMMMMV
jgi:hypothetical protein